MFGADGVKNYTACFVFCHYLIVSHLIIELYICLSRSA
jgi:hypothetical protein